MTIYERIKTEAQADALEAVRPVQKRLARLEERVAKIERTMPAADSDGWIPRMHSERIALVKRRVREGHPRRSSG